MPVNPRTALRRNLPGANRLTAQTPRGRDQLAATALADEFASARAREGEAAGSRAETLGAIRGYDPAGYAKSTGEAIYAGAAEDRLSADASRKAGLNRRGLFGSNLGGARADRDFHKYLARATAGLGMQAAGLEGQNIDRLGGLYRTDAGRAESGRERSLEFLSGERDRDTAEENARREQEAKKVPWWKKALDIGTGVVGIGTGIGAAGGVGGLLGGLFGGGRR